MPRIMIKGGVWRNTEVKQTILRFTRNCVLISLVEIFMLLILGIALQ